MKNEGEMYFYLKQHRKTDGEQSAPAQTIWGTEVRFVLFHVCWGALGKNRGIWSRKLYRAWHESLNMCSIIIWLQKWLYAAKCALCALLCATGYLRTFGHLAAKGLFSCMSFPRSNLSYYIQLEGICYLDEVGRSPQTLNHNYSKPHSCSILLL